MNALPLLLFGSLFGLLHPAAPVTTTKTYGVGEWVLVVKTDSFRQTSRCTISNHHGRDPDVTIADGMVSFHLGGGTDVSDAWYRLDGGPPRAVRDDYAALIAQGAFAEAERLDNPSGGVVRLPLASLGRAGTAAFQVTRASQLKQFKLGNMRPVSDAAERSGCSKGTSGRNARGQEPLRQTYLQSSAEPLR